MANHLPFLVAVAAGLLATPALAQNNQPIGSPPATGVQWNAQWNTMPPPPPAALYAGQPPAAGAMQGGMPREAWLGECARRLNEKQGMALDQVSATCTNWWNFYQAGGAPHPTYGYAVPVNATETSVDCPEEVVETRVIRRKVIIRKARRYNDKRVKI